MNDALGKIRHREEINNSRAFWLGVGLLVCGYILGAITVILVMML